MKQKESLSNEQKYQSIIEWKKIYNIALIDALKPFEAVLEIGFGNGVAASYIQTLKPKNHMIIEADSNLAPVVKQWAKGQMNVSVIEGSWQRALSSLPTFDAVFLNDCSENTELELLRYFYPEDMATLSLKAKQTLEVLEERFEEVDHHYSDNEIEEFYEKIGKSNKKELPSFFSKLKENGNISEQQYKSIEKKYNLEGVFKGIDSTAGMTRADLLKELIQKHMHKGSIFSCFLANQSSLRNNPWFIENIINNRSVEYKEKLEPIKMAESFGNDKLQQALIITIRKLT